MSDSNPDNDYVLAIRIQEDWYHVDEDEPLGSTNVPTPQCAGCGNSTCFMVVDVTPLRPAMASVPRTVRCNPLVTDGLNGTPGCGADYPVAWRLAREVIF